MNQDRIAELIELAKVDNSRLFGQLISALVHEERSIVIGASLLLGRLGDDRAVPSLLRAFLTTDQEVGTAVAWALGQCRSPLAIPFLSKAIEKGFAVANACEALGHLGNEEVLPTLFDALKAEHEDVRACAAKALGSIASRSDQKLREEIRRNLTPLFADKSRKVRICSSIIVERIAQRISE